jgi:hypothetical protein
MIRAQLCTTGELTWTVEYDHTKVLGDLRTSASASRGGARSEVQIAADGLVSRHWSLPAGS